jgi:hypothetical protein
MNSYLKVDMQLSIKTFATLANFLQPIGRKDTDAYRGFHLPTFFIYYKNHYLRLSRSSGPLDCEKVAEIDWQRVAEE